MATKIQDERREHFQTSSGIELPADLNPSNTTALDYDRDLGAPGEFPYTRGIYPNMYRGKVWTMRQYAGFGSAGETNKRFRYLLAQGQGGLSVAFDLPTQMGYDSDDPMALGEVGRVGVPIDSLVDMEALFADIPLDTVSTSMTINATAAILLVLYEPVARRAHDHQPFDIEADHHQRHQRGPQAAAGIGDSNGNGRQHQRRDDARQ